MEECWKGELGIYSEGFDGHVKKFAFYSGDIGEPWTFINIRIWK